MHDPSRAVLTRRDAAILERLPGRFGESAGRRIRAVAARARTVLPERAGRDIVMLCSRVARAIEDAPPDMRIPVPSEAATLPDMTLPAHTPRERIRVLAVARRPKAARRTPSPGADILASAAPWRIGRSRQLRTGSPR